MSDGQTVVLDTSAVIAFLNGEPGGEKVGPRMQGALLSSVNLCEIVSKYAEWGEDAEETLRNVEELEVIVVPFTPAHALSAAQLRPTTRALGLSLGDRACLALGLEQGATVLTADKAWEGLEGHRIEVLR